MEDNANSKIKTHTEAPCVNSLVPDSYACLFLAVFHTYCPTESVSGANENDFSRSPTLVHKQMEFVSTDLRT